MLPQAEPVLYRSKRPVCHVTVQVLLCERYWVMGRRPRRGSPGVSRFQPHPGWSRDSWGAVRWIRATSMPWDRRKPPFQTVFYTFRSILRWNMTFGHRWSGVPAY